MCIRDSFSAVPAVPPPLSFLGRGPRGGQKGRKLLCVFPRGNARRGAGAAVTVGDHALAPLLECPHPCAAGKLGVCCTTMKKSCRKRFGIAR
eukprot:3935603-Rhodomonas_salina.1